MQLFPPSLASALGVAHAGKMQEDHPTVKEDCKRVGPHLKIQREGRASRRLIDQNLEGALRQMNTE
jgi:hypothetical protein